MRHEPQQIDLEFMEWLGENGVPFSIVFTKADKVAKRKEKADRAEKEKERKRAAKKVVKELNTVGFKALVAQPIEDKAEV